MFRKTEWDRRPQPVQKLKDGRYIVTRHVAEEAREDENGEPYTVYVGELAFMTELVYAAYEGAKEIAREICR